MYLQFSLIFILFINKSKNRVFLKNNKFYCYWINWTFNQKKVGLYAYGKGFKKRISELTHSYHLEKNKFSK